MARESSPSHLDRVALVNGEVLWTKEVCAAYLGCSERTLHGLDIPRITGLGGVRYVPDVVREWARRQLSHQLPAAA